MKIHPILILTSLIVTLNGSPITRSPNGAQNVGHSIHKRNLFGANSSLSFLPDLLNLISSADLRGGTGNRTGISQADIINLVPPITVAVITGIKTALFNSSLPTNGIFGLKTGLKTISSGVSFSTAPVLYRVRPIVYDNHVNPLNIHNRFHIPEESSNTLPQTHPVQNTKTPEKDDAGLQNLTTEKELPISIAENTPDITKLRKLIDDNSADETNAIDGPELSVDLRYGSIPDVKPFTSPTPVDKDITKRATTNISLQPKRRKRNAVSVDSGYSKVSHASPHVTKRQATSFLPNFFSWFSTRPEPYNLRPIIFNVPSENRMSTINIVQSLSNILGENTDTISSVTTFNVSSDTSEGNETSNLTKHHGYISQNHTTGTDEDGIEFKQHSQLASHESHQVIEFGLDSDNHIHQRRKRQVPLNGLSDSFNLPDLSSGLPAVSNVLGATETSNLDISGGFNTPGLDTNSNQFSSGSQNNLNDINFENTLGFDNQLDLPTSTTSSLDFGGFNDNTNQLPGALPTVPTFPDSLAITGASNNGATNPQNIFEQAFPNREQNNNKFGLPATTSLSASSFGNTPGVTNQNFASGFTLGNANQPTFLDSVAPTGTSGSNGIPMSVQNIFEQAFPNREHSGEIYQQNSNDPSSSLTSSSFGNTPSVTNQNFASGFTLGNVNQPTFQDSVASIGTGASNGVPTSLLNIFEQAFPNREHSGEIYQQNSNDLSTNTPATLTALSFGNIPGGRNENFASGLTFGNVNQPIFQDSLAIETTGGEPTSLQNVFEQAFPNREHSGEIYQQNSNDATLPASSFGNTPGVTTQNFAGGLLFGNINQPTEQRNDMNQFSLSTTIPTSGNTFNIPVTNQNLASEFSFGNVNQPFSSVPMDSFTSEQNIFEQAIPNREHSGEIYQQNNNDINQVGSTTTPSTLSASFFDTSSVTNQNFGNQFSFGDTNQPAVPLQERFATTGNSASFQFSNNGPPTNLQNIFEQAFPNREHSGEIYQQNSNDFNQFGQSTTTGGTNLPGVPNQNFGGDFSFGNQQFALVQDSLTSGANVQSFGQSTTTGGINLPGVPNQNFGGNSNFGNQQFAPFQDSLPSGANDQSFGQSTTTPSSLSSFENTPGVPNQNFGSNFNFGNQQFATFQDSLSTRANDGTTNTQNIFEQAFPNREHSGEIYQPNSNDFSTIGNLNQPFVASAVIPMDSFTTSGISGVLEGSMNLQNIFEQAFPNREHSGEIYQNENEVTPSNLNPQTRLNTRMLLLNVFEQMVPIREHSKENYQTENDLQGININIAIMPGQNDNQNTFGSVSEQIIPSQASQESALRGDFNQNMFELFTPNRLSFNDGSFDNILEQKIPNREHSGEIYQRDQQIDGSNTQMTNVPFDQTGFATGITSLDNRESRRLLNGGTFGLDNGLPSVSQPFISNAQREQNLSTDGLLYVVPTLKDPVDFGSVSSERFQGQFSISPKSLLATAFTEDRLVPQVDSLPLDPGYFDMNPNVLRNSYGEAVFRNRK